MIVMAADAGKRRAHHGSSIRTYGSVLGSGTLEAGGLIPDRQCEVITSGCAPDSHCRG
jgi:hypothetical protein